MISSDFIFAAIGEEMGFIGSSLVLLLFLMFTVPRQRASCSRSATCSASCSAQGSW